AEESERQDMRILPGGTDNHLSLIDLTKHGITGKDAEKLIEKVRIIVNKNTVPFETRSPFITSGIRVGTPAVTTRGMKDAEMRTIAECIATTIRERDHPKVLEEVSERVAELCKQHPVPM
ncbi:serine hydroxymethyltransferase, partial [Methanosarcinales archaeon]